MTIRKLIESLEDFLNVNELDDCQVVGIANGIIYDNIDMNCPYRNAPLYIELEK